jgi:hypothetical protein
MLEIHERNADFSFPATLLTRGTRTYHQKVETCFLLRAVLLAQLFGKHQTAVPGQSAAGHQDGAACLL